jgi:hypothetical protein
VDTEEMNRDKSINQAINDLYGEKVESTSHASIPSPSPAPAKMYKEDLSMSQTQSKEAKYDQPKYDQPKYASDDTTVFGTVGRGFHWLWENI